MRRKQRVMDAQINIEHYYIFRSDRQKSKNGGVLLYIDKDIIVDKTDTYTVC